jgi:hypothetical protein
MNTVTRRQFEMLTRVRDFGTTYASQFPEASLAKEALAAVDASIKQLEVHDVAEMAASASARATRKGAARKALMELLLKAQQTARVIKASKPDLDLPFQLPRQPQDQELLTAGRQFAQDGARHAAAFQEHGMPPTFVADLEQLVERFEAALRDRGVSRGERVAARTRIGTCVAAAIEAVRKLDVIVANHPWADTAVATVWKRLRRTTPTRKTAATEAKVTAPAPSTTAAPAESTTAAASAAPVSQ